MKALPLWQPWATLIALEAKRIETRHWPPPRDLVGQRLAIFASKRLLVSDCKRDPFRQYVPRPHDLPLSAIVCTCVLVGVDEITPGFARALRIDNPEEFAFGNYRPGFGGSPRRYAWRLTDVERLDEPIPWKWPFKGPAKFFEIPDDLQPPDGSAPVAAPEPAFVQGSLLDPTPTEEASRR